jgi:dolichyl-phosphate-mannose-protein mannosyltransferase
MSSMEKTPDGPFQRGLPFAFDFPRVNAFAMLLALTLCVGLLLRLRGYWGDFPLFDGGMFYMMIGDIQENGYRLPHLTSYNGGVVPFNYPPFAFYLAAALDDIGLSRVFVMQALPALASAATVGAVYLLAEPFLRSKWAGLAATFAFAVMPETFSWMIGGGGLTRALGFLFAVLALGQVYRMYTRPERRYVALSTVFVALTVLTHLEMTMFLALSAGVMFAFFGVSRQGVMRTATVCLAALVATAPWWGTLVSRSGLDPWLNSGSSRGILGEDSLTVLTHLNLTGQFFIDLMWPLALAGVVICVMRREFFLPAWLVAIALLMPWVFTRMASVPAALLIGAVLVTYVWPWLREGIPGMRLKAPPPAWLAPAFVAVLVASSLTSGIQGNRNVLVTLSDDTRQAMEWVETSTGESDRFLVVTGRPWYHDHVGEWFPALTDRVSVATVQGREWLGSFNDEVEAHKDLQQCIDRDVECIERWERDALTGFTYIYVSRELPPDLEDRDIGECCGPLRESLFASDTYRVAYQNSAATIFMRVPEPAPEDVLAGR